MEKVRSTDAPAAAYKYFYSVNRYDAYHRLTGQTRYWRPTGLEDPQFNLHYGWLSYGVTYVHNDLSVVVEMGDTQGGLAWSEPVYNVLGQLTSARLGNGLTTTYSYEAGTHRLDGIQAATRTRPARHHPDLHRSCHQGPKRSPLPDASQIPGE